MDSKQKLKKHTEEKWFTYRYFIYYLFVLVTQHQRILMNCHELLDLAFQKKLWSLRFAK